MVEQSSDRFHSRCPPFRELREEGRCPGRGLFNVLEVCGQLAVCIHSAWLVPHQQRRCSEFGLCLRHSFLSTDDVLCLFAQRFLGFRENLLAGAFGCQRFVEGLLVSRQGVPG